MEEALRKLIQKILGSKHEYLRFVIQSRDDLVRLIDSIEDICIAPVRDKKVLINTFKIQCRNSYDYVYDIDGLEKKEKLIFPLIVKLTPMHTYKYDTNSRYSSEDRGDILSICKNWMVDSNLNGSSVEYLRTNYGVKIEIENQESSLDEFLQVYTEGQDAEVVKYKKSLNN